MYRSILARLEALDLSGITGHPTIPVPSDLLDKLTASTKDQVALIETMIHRHQMITQLLHGKESKEISHDSLAEAHGILTSVLQKFVEIQELIKDVEKCSTSVQGHLHVRQEQLRIVSQESKTICDLMQHFQRVFGQAMGDFTEDQQ